MKDNTAIIEEIVEYINSQGGEYSKWYVGITDNIQRRLRNEHNVPTNSPWWLTFGAADKTGAEMIERYFLDQGCQGDTGGGNENSRIVYAYLITSTSVQ